MFRLFAFILIALGLSAQDAMVTVRKEGARKETVSLTGLSVSGANATVFLKRCRAIWSVPAGSVWDPRVRYGFPDGSWIPVLEFHPASL